MSNMEEGNTELRSQCIINISGDTDIDNSNSVLVKIATLYAEKLMNDVCLIVDGMEFPCHRLILSATSDVFQVMLMNPRWSESAASHVVLVETKECSVIFGDFLKYFYTGKIKMNLYSVLPILLLADKYNVKDLVKFCLDYMCDHIAQAAKTNTFVSWFHYIYSSNHVEVAKTYKNFIKWNFEKIASAKDFGNLEPNIIINLLQQSDLVVHNEMTLYKYIYQWLDFQKEKFPGENDMEELVMEVVAYIRFPMMYPRELAELLLNPLIKKYKEIFFERMALGMAFHSGDEKTIKKVGDMKGGSLLFTPRLYTDDAYSAPLTIEKYNRFPTFKHRTLVFTLKASLVDCECREYREYRECCEYCEQVEWIIDFYPKGVKFQDCLLIVGHGTRNVPGEVLKVVRLSITCKDPPADPGCVKVKIGILIYGVQDNIEHVMAVYEKNHSFSELEKTCNLDHVLPYWELNFNVTNNSSKYLVGEDRDVLKMRVIIAPLMD